MSFKNLFSEYKTEVSFLIIILLVVGGIASFIFYNKGNREFSQRAVANEALILAGKDEDYQKLVIEVEGLTSKKNNLETVIDNYSEDLKILKEEKQILSKEINNQNETLNKIENAESVVSDLKLEETELTKNIDSLTSEVNNLLLEKENVEREIEKLQGNLVEAAGAPIELQPGMWFQDIDEIPVGRYTVSNGDSNFFVRDEDGVAYVNIILDDSDSGWGVAEYTFVLIEGAIIEADSACTLTPVK